MRISLVALCLGLAACQPDSALIQLPHGWSEPESAVVALEQEAYSLALGGLLQRNLLVLSQSNSARAEPRPDALAASTRILSQRDSTRAEPRVSLATEVLEASTRTLSHRNSEPGLSLATDALEASSRTVPCGSNWVARAMCMVAVCIFLLVATGLTPSHYRTPEITLTVHYCVVFFSFLSFTVVIPSSYSMARVVGLGAAYSGLLIGLYHVGVCASAVVLWHALRVLPDIWRSSFPMILAGTCFNLLGATLYFALSVAAEPFTSGEAVEHTKPWMACPLIVSRLLDGFGSGIILQLGHMLIIHVMPSEQRASWRVSIYFSTMLGIGLGPMVSSAMSSLNFCHSSTGQFAAVGVGYVGLALSSTLLVVTRFPRSMRDVTDHAPPTDPTIESGTAIKDARGRIILILGSLIMCMMRAFVVSGLEAATALLLEVEYGWGLTSTGIAVGVCFLSCVPVKLVFNAFEDRLSLTSWVRVAGSGAVVGGVLLFRWSDSAFVLLVGDALVFPLLFLGDAISGGIMVMSQHLLPQGSWFDANHVVLQRAIFSCLGRGTGPPLARIIVHSSGQNGYAAMQLVVAVLFLVVFETCITPNVKLGVEEAKQ